jgi:putative glutamine amidotransferase
MMGRPIIGITSELEAAHWGDWIREAVVSPVSYIRAVERAGAAPVVLPPVPPDTARALVARLDGLVFTGGKDLDPALYDQQRLDETDLPDYRRDRFELTLMRAALEAGLPFLAIGRGLHVLTVARGGALTQHLPAHRQDRVRYLPHDVRLSGDSLLGRVLGGAVRVPAAHHQAPARVGEGLTVAGWSPDDDVVEALEVAGHRFGVGVHWHPEEGDDTRLLDALVAAAGGPPVTPPAAAKAAPAKTESAKTEPAKAEPAKAEPAKPEPAKAEPKAEAKAKAESRSR